jgi:hypothetical protein
MIPESCPRIAYDLHLQRIRKITKHWLNFSPVAFMFAAVLAMGSVFISTQTATAQITFPEGQCTKDVACKSGNCANDVPGQKDLTKWCADAGTGVYELYSLWNWDEIALSGTNTLDGCTLYDTDADSLANIAVCVTVRSNGALGATRLFTCNDTSPIKCAGGVQVSGNTCDGGLNDGKPCTDAASCAPKKGAPGACVPAGNTTCAVDTAATDPFPPVGASSPNDKQTICQVDLGDFGLGAATSVDLIDACSYTSQNPFSGVADCVATKDCKSASECNDGNVCTTDSCSSASGTCVNTNNTVSCNDGNACTTGDICGGGTCAGTDASAQDCDDDNVCTTDSCDAQTGCVNTNNTAPCSDGSACTTADTCAGGSCVGGVAPNCDDTNGCTDDSCNPATGCVNTNNTNSCDDNNACTTADTCSSGSCVGGATLSCDDNEVCTTDSCNTQTGCVYTNNANSCNDGDACTLSDVCSNGVCEGSNHPPAQGCVNDSQNADEIAAQKDMTGFCKSTSANCSGVVLAWQWDDTSFGSQTGDACALYDTDADGKANFALCVTVDGAGSASPAQLYRCDDSKPLNCHSAQLVLAPASSCTVNITATDPFASSHQTGGNPCNGTDCLSLDTQAQCCVQASDFSPATATLIDVCSYPSSSPDSNPSDCVQAVACSNSNDCVVNGCQGTCTDGICVF